MNRIMWVILIFAIFIDLGVTEFPPEEIVHDYVGTKWHYITEHKGPLVSPPYIHRELPSSPPSLPISTPSTEATGQPSTSPERLDSSFLDNKNAILRLEQAVNDISNEQKRNLRKINERYEALVNVLISEFYQKKDPDDCWKATEKREFLRQASVPSISSLSVPTKTSEVLSCDDGWIRYKNSCMLISEDKVSFGEADLKCAILGSHLVKIEDTQHWAFVRQVLSESAWIGLSDYLKKGVFRWPSDDTIFVFSKYDMSEDVEDCVILHKGNQYQFTDVSCRANHHFICEKAPTLKEQRCPEGTKYAAGFCYHLSEVKGNWQSGIWYCQEKGLSYAKVITKAQWKVLSDHIQEDTWIGLNDQEKEGHFVWQSDGSQAFTPWSDKNPDERDADEVCVHLQKSSGYQWNDRKCSYEAQFLCETKLDGRECLAGFTKFQSSCYFLNTGKHDWLSAKKICEDMGAYLAKISTAEEQDCVIEMLSADTWFGLSDMDGEGDFKWTKDGEDLFGDIWHFNDPNNHRNLQHCVSMGPNWSDGLVDHFCTETFKFACTTQPTAI